MPAMISIRKFTVNPLQENSYLLFDDTGGCLLVDAGFYSPAERSELSAFIAANGLKPLMLLNTHCHFDHLWAVESLRKEYRIPFLHHSGDRLLLEQAAGQGALFGFFMEPVLPADRLLTGGETLRFGNSSLQVIHVPGHSPGHVAFHSPDQQFVLCGDVLFRGSIGRSDLPGGDYFRLLESIHDRLLTLPPQTTVYCGHGPDTTISREKKENPFLI